MTPDPRRALREVLTDEVLWEACSVAERTWGWAAGPHANSVDLEGVRDTLIEVILAALPVEAEPPTCGHVLRPRGLPRLVCDLGRDHVTPHEATLHRDRYWWDESGHGVLHTPTEGR